MIGLINIAFFRNNRWWFFTNKTDQLEDFYFEIETLPELKKTELLDSTRFFYAKLLHMTSMKNSLFEMPKITCFSYCIKEMISLCEISKEIGNRDYFKLAEDFYEFEKKDFIFKEIDPIQHSLLLIKLKEICENVAAINLTMVLSYFENMLKIFQDTYIDALVSKVKQVIEGEITDYDKISYITESFLNELLSKGYTYKYLSKTFKFYFFQNDELDIFHTFDAFVKFLFKYTDDSISMYLPLKNVRIADIDFINNNSIVEQKIVLSDDINGTEKIDLPLNKYYCHIYSKYNDYYRGMEEHIKRIRSIFNVLKFYTSSQLDFDYESICLINSNKFGMMERNKINEILRYSNFQGNRKTMEIVLKSFANMKEQEDPILEDIFDIMNSSQKNSDTLSNDQFVSKWISLETISSKNPLKKGFDSVFAHVPRFLAITLFRKQFNSIAYNSYKKGKYSRIGLREFIGLIYNGDEQYLLSLIKNPYYKYQMAYYCDLIKNPNKLDCEIEKYSKRIEFLLYRMYILRNKYVHFGDTQIYSDILRYAINQIEPFFFDKIIKSNNVLRSRRASVTWSLIFADLRTKYDIIYLALKLLDVGNIKVSKTININYPELIRDKNEVDLIKNIIFENHIKMLEESLKYKETSD